MFSISHLIEMLFFLLFCHSFSFDPLSFDSGFMFWFFLWNVWFFFQFHPWINECYFPFISLFSIWSSFFIYIYIGAFYQFFFYFHPLTLKCYFSYFVLILDLIPFLLILGFCFEFLCEMFDFFNFTIEFMNVIYPLSFLFNI